MPEQLQQQAQEAPSQKVESYQYQMQPQPKDLGVDFQKWITGADHYKMAFFEALCGWQLVTEQEEYEFNGKLRKRLVERLHINELVRIINEEGASQLWGDIRPLISHSMVTSKLAAIDIYNDWNGTIEVIIHDLDRSYDNGNPYHLDYVRMPKIVSFLLRFKGNEMKALDGFTLTKLADTNQTTALLHYGIPPQQGQSKGGLGALISGLFHKNQG